jgi:hypothetical protein
LERVVAPLGELTERLAELTDAAESARRAAATLTRIEAALLAAAEPDESLEAIRRGVDRAGAAIESLAGQWSAGIERSNRVAQEQLAHTLKSLKDALELLHVSMEQGNTLYRSIVKKMLPFPVVPSEQAA